MDHLTSVKARDGRERFIDAAVAETVAVLEQLLVAGRTETAHGPELPGVIEPALVGAIADYYGSPHHQPR